MEALPVKEIYWKATEEEYFLFSGRKNISDGSSFRVFKSGNDISGEFRINRYNDGSVIFYNIKDEEYFITFDEFYDEFKLLSADSIKSKLIVKMFNDENGKRKVIAFYNGQNISDKLSGKSLENNRVEFYSPDHNIKFKLYLYDSRYDLFNGVDL